MHTDLTWLRAYPDQHTAELIDETLELLGHRRGYLGPSSSTPPCACTCSKASTDSYAPTWPTPSTTPKELGYTLQQIHQLLDL
jgi:hypothetical protein